MSSNYEDILYQKYPYPTKRKKMEMVDRGAQFSPFAALTGYDAAIQETGRLTDQQVDLDVDEKALLDEKIRILYEVQQENPEIQILYFEPDVQKSGGSYQTLSGSVRKLLISQQSILMDCGKRIPFNRIREIGGEIFQKIEQLSFTDQLQQQVDIP